MSKNLTKIWVSVIILAAMASTLCANLKELATITPATTHRSSSYDRTGGNIDCVSDIRPGQSVVLLDADGPGCINHIWITMSEFAGHRTWTRDLVIRMYWDHAQTPSVQVPLGDFFALGHGREYNVQSIPVCVGENNKALNCYWPMPFNRHGRVEIVNQGQRSIRRLFYNIDYDLGPIGENRGLFHARFHRDKAVPGQHPDEVNVDENYVILETTGRGQYVGCVLNVDAAPGGWWGEGDEVIWIDQEKPTIFGTGSEDYFCNAWGFDRVFTYPCYGVPLMENLQGGRKLTTAYRWHVYDPYRFQEYIKVTMEHVYSTNVFNDYSSVAFWYQDQPATRQPALPMDNLPRYDPPKKNTSGVYSIDGTELEPLLCKLGVDARARATGPELSQRSWLQIAGVTEVLAFPLSVDEEGIYQLAVRPWFTDKTGTFAIGVSRDQLITLAPPAPKISAPVVIGQTPSHNGTITIYLQSSTMAGLDYIVLRKLNQESQ